MEFVVLYRLVDLIDFIFILSCSVNIEKRDPYFGDFIRKKPLYSCLCWDIIQTDLFEALGDDRHPWTLQFWYQFEWPWPSFKVIVILWERRISNHFLTDFFDSFDEIWYATNHDQWKLISNTLCRITLQGQKLPRWFIDPYEYHIGPCT